MRTFTLFLLLFITISSYSQEKKIAVQNVKQAAFNYIDTFYKADTTLAYKSIRKNIRKIGWWYTEKNKSYSNDIEMPFDELISFAKKWNAKGDKTTKDSPREVEILEVSDKIAVAKVTAAWGIDYLSLVSTKDGWKIINVVWQTKPKFSVRE